MTTVVGTGKGNASIYGFFVGFGDEFVFDSQIGYIAQSNTSFTLIRPSFNGGLATLDVSGPGFTYTDLGNNYITADGTITTVTYTLRGSTQTWTGLNVSMADALTAIANRDELAFNSLFFGGNDIFNWTDLSGSSTAGVLYGFGGNDVFNIGDMDANGGSRYIINGGDGSDTLNITGGIGAGIGSGDLGSGNLSNFRVTNVETVKLSAGSAYKIFAGSDVVTSGHTLTVDGSALGASDQLIFNTNVAGGYGSVAGDLVLLGGAADDVLEGGTGYTIFNGGGGSNTVSFLWSQQASHAKGVTADLSNAGVQNFGPGWGTGTFINIQNLIGTRGNDLLTGNAGNNVLTVGSNISFQDFGNDILIGGAGNDTAVIFGTRSNYTVTTAGGTTMVTGANGTATLTGIEQIRFDDQTISASGSGITVSHAPVITSSNFSASRNQTIALSDFFAIGNPSGEAITRYQLWDATRDNNSGYFVVNGIQQQAGTIVEITAAQLAQTTFVSGKISDSLQIRALNALGWSAGDNAAWAPFTVAVPQDQAPSVTTQNVSIAAGKALTLSSLVSVTDAEGDSITSYQLWDSVGNPASGHWVVNGVAQAAGTIINVSSWDLYSTYFLTGSVTDNLQVRASDGILWSASENAAWAPFTITAVPNSAPVVTTSDKLLFAGNTAPPNFLFQVSDADNDTITKYQFWVSTRDSEAGYFLLNGSRQPAATTIEVTPQQLSQLTYVAGSVATQVEIRAFDGQAWSAPDNGSWSPFFVLPSFDHAPVVSTSNVSAARNQSFALSLLYTATDADSDPVTKLQLLDSNSNPLSGHFEVNGVVQPANTVIEITGSQINQTFFIAGAVADTLHIRAFDGELWSAGSSPPWSPFTVSPPANNAPVVTTSNTTKAHLQSFALSSLFSVSDADSDTITKYQLWDASREATSGYFTINGAKQAAGTIIEIAASQLSQTAFVTGTTGDSLQIRAFDGISWSAGDNAAWAPFAVGIAPNNAPVVTTSNTTKGHLQSFALSGLFSVSDADSDTITKYQLWDASREASSGYFTVNGAKQAAGTVIEITAAQLGQTSFVTGTTGDNLQIRAFDGIGWSAGDSAAWAPFTVTVPANNAPVVATSNTTKTHLQSLALSSLFSVSDADSDAITRYQLWDSTSDASSGYFTVGGIKQAAGTVIDITAAQLAQTAFVTGTTSDSLQIRAFDGIGWSAGDSAAWAPFTVTVPANSAPVVTTGTVNAMHGRTLALSSLISVSDSDGDTMTRYQLWDASREASSGTFTINGVAQAAGTVIEVSAAQLAQTAFVTGTTSDSLQIRTFDGYAWSAGDSAAWSPFNVAVTPYTAPTLTTVDKSATPNQSFTLSSLISVTDTDGDTMTRYQLWDSSHEAGSGHWMINNVAQNAGTVIDITAAQLAQTSFLAGALGDSLQVRAFDGISWTAADNAAWAPFHVNV